MDGTTPGSICLVANDLAHLVRNGGVGTYFWLLAHLLARHGFRVHVLFANDHLEDPAALPRVRQRLAVAGIGFSTVTDFPAPPHFDLPTHGSNDKLQRSERVRHVLEQFHARHRFDLIEFADWGATGFRTVQARRTGLAFGDVRLLVKLHGSSQWGREGNHQWPASKEDLRTDFAERFAFDHADLQASPCHSMLDYARGAGWQVRADAQVIPYPFPDRPAAAATETGRIGEVVFFGRLEVRKGLLLFLEACQDLDPSVPLRFVGKDTVLEDGRRASALIRARLRGRKVSLYTRFNQEEALAYLRGPGRLAVLPSLQDNVPFTVIECSTQGIPFVASAVGGIPELLGDPSLRGRILFEPAVPELRRCLLATLQADPEEQRHLAEQVRAATDPERNNRRVVEVYRQLVARAGVSANPVSDASQKRLSLTPTLRRSVASRHGPSNGLAEDAPLLVSVVVTHYNLAAHLPEALASLAAQTYPQLDGIVIDDGSTDPQALQVWQEQEQRYPHYRFLRQDNRGPGAARNRGLAEARGKYVVFLDADNVALPGMVATFVRGLECNPEVTALTCYVLGFRQDGDGPGRQWLFQNAFAGGPHLLACVENVYGDTTAIFRTADLRAAGGCESDRSTPWEDWLTYLKLVHAGYRVEVVPACLLLYRVREGRTARMNQGRLDEDRHTLHLLRKYFSGPLLPSGVDAASLWPVLVGFARLGDRYDTLRHRLVERLNQRLRNSPWLHRALKTMVRLLGRLARLGRSSMV